MSQTRLDRALRYWKDDGAHEELRLLREVEQAAMAVRALVDAQAEDHSLWFDAESCPEAYVQQELRKLHAAVEAIPLDLSRLPVRDSRGGVK